MSANPHSVLFYGDSVLARKDLVKIKKKHSSSQWIEFSLEKDSMNRIRSEIGFIGFGSENKIVVVYDLPNRKAEKEFLIDIATNHIPNIIVVIFDSKNILNDRTDTALSFIKDFKAIPNCKIVNNGEEFTEKEDQDVCKYVQSLFAKNNKTISYDVSALMVQIVGRKRNLLVSEVDKLILTAPDVITADFISANCFPIFQESILYKLGNVIDGGSYSQSIVALKEFIENDVHPNVIGEILAKKARWRLAASHLWAKGMSWYEVESSLVQMGKFPSVIWHDEKLPYSSKKAYDKLKNGDDAFNFLNKEMGIPHLYLKELKKDTFKFKAGDALPMPFLASLLVKSIQVNLVEPNSKTYKDEELRKKVLNHSVGVYLAVTDKLKDMRYYADYEQDLFSMVKLLTNRNI